MGKFDLGVSSTKLVKDIDKNKLYVNIKKTDRIIDDMDKQLSVIRVSLSNISMLLHKCVKDGYVKGSRADTFRGWARKAKSQSNSVNKFNSMLDEKYSSDVYNYPIHLLDLRIEELEKKIAQLEKK